MEIKIISFGYKNGAPPIANLVLDVRFLKNPYWVEELRPLTGKDEPVRKYILDQPLALNVLRSLSNMLSHVIPVMLETKTTTFKIALGCTGGQHRSTALAEALAEQLKESFPNVNIEKYHRELDALPDERGDETCDQSIEDSCGQSNEDASRETSPDSSGESSESASEESTRQTANR